MRKTILILLTLLVPLATWPLYPQASTIPNLTLDASPAETDMIEVRKAGDARDKKTTRSTFFSTTKSCLANQVVASPNGLAGLLTCRSLTSADIPALAYITGLSGPTGITWTGTTALTGTWASESANFSLFAPNGSAGAPTWRAMLFGDLPTIATGRLYGSVSASTAAPGSVTVSAGLNLSASGVLTATGSGTVTSVSGPTQLSWATSTTTPAATWVSQSANTVLAAPSGGAGTPLFRLLAAVDIPTISAATQLSNTLQAAQFPALTGDITTPAGSLATTLKTSPTITTPVINKPTIGIVGTAGSSHIKGIGTSPTVSCTGLGTGGASAVSGPDLGPVVTMTAGSSASTTGTCTVTMNGTFTNNATCIATLANGTGAWQVTSVVILSTSSATAPQFTWADNNSGAPASLTNGQTYLINIICIER